MTSHLELKSFLDKFPNLGYDGYTKIDAMLSRDVKQYFRDKTYSWTGKLLINTTNGFISAQMKSEKDPVLCYIPLGVAK